MIRSSHGPTPDAASSEGTAGRARAGAAAAAARSGVGRERRPGGGSAAPGGSVTVAGAGGACGVGAGGEIGEAVRGCWEGDPDTATGRNSIRVRPAVTATGTARSRAWRWMIGSLWPSTTTGVLALRFSKRMRPSARGSTRSWSRDTDWSPAITQRGSSRCGPRPNSSGPDGCSNAVRWAGLETSMCRAMGESRGGQARTGRTTSPSRSVSR